MNSIQTTSRVIRAAERVSAISSRSIQTSARRTTTAPTIRPPCPSQPHHHNLSHPASKPFSTTPIHQKKGGKATRDEKQSTPPSTKTSTPAGSEDPFDFSALETDITKALETLKTDLSKLRAGGRFNPETLENLRVSLEKGSSKTEKLSDVAQVIPKGRTVQVLVGEREHAKPVTSAILSSPLSLTPQPDAQNPLAFTIAIPPPTADSRRAAVAEAGKAGEKAGTAVRDARGRQQKKLRAMQLGRSVRPDDLKKAGGLMEKVVERGSGEVKKVVEGVRRGLERG